LDNGTCSPTVTPGNTYIVSVSYEASAPVYFTVYTRSTSGTWSLWTKSPNFISSQTFFGTATWVTPRIPAGVNGIGFGMTLASNGSVTTTSYSLVNNGPAGAPPSVVTGWSVVPSPNVSQVSNSLGVVSCTSASFCMAVGQNNVIGTSVIEQWDGSDWKVDQGPTAGALEGVSCTSPSFCVIVGISSLGGSLIEQWNGTVWSAVPSPPGGELLGVSCTSPSFCMAVSINGSGALAEKWNGTAWSLVPIPDTDASGFQVGPESLNGVSCTSASFCMAVGQSIVQNSQTITVRWNGTAWSIVPSPNVTAPNSAGTLAPTANALSAVSCTSASACTAVGGAGGSFPTFAASLVERWNGATWSIEPSPNVGTTDEGGSNELLGVSCTSAATCSAVGSALVTDSVLRGPWDYQTVVEQWNGTAWSVVPSQNPSPTSNGLSGVSCTSASTCTAVGHVLNSTLVESTAAPSTNPPPVPAVTGVTPNSGPPVGGTPVTITGSGFTGATWVTFDGISATNPIVLNDSTITALTPTILGAASRDVMVTTPGGSSAISTADHFTYTYPIPVVTGITPNSGPKSGGTSLSITGSGFTGATSVTIDGVSVSNLALENDSFIIASTPALPAGTYDVLVTTPGGISAPSSADRFTALSISASVVVSSVTPNSGPTSGGIAVTVTGTGFTGATAVNFNGVPGINMVVASDSRIVVYSPAESAGSGDVQVVTPLGTNAFVSADQFTYVANLPTVSTISPAIGPSSGGTSVTITGTNFSAATHVLFGTVPATNFAVVSSTKITATTPAGVAGVVGVFVTTSVGTSGFTEGDGFAYWAQPSVSSVSPNSGPTTGGTSITITGKNFVAGAIVVIGQGHGAVAGAIIATNVNVVSPTEITAITAGGAEAATWNLFVITSGGTSATTAGDSFTYTAPPAEPPSVTSVSPNSGPTTGGTSITITGKNFVAGATVVIGQGNGAGAGAIGATNVNVVSPTEITATTAGGAEAATWNLFVITSGGTSPTTAGDSFTYAVPPPPPSVTSVSPNSGPSAGGTSITITGKNFVAGATVVIGQGNGAGAGAISATNVKVVSPTEITATTAGGA
jgi:IPT/TIG domain